MPDTTDGGDSGAFTQEQVDLQITEALATAKGENDTAFDELWKEAKAAKERAKAFGDLDPEDIKTQLGDFELNAKFEVPHPRVVGLFGPSGSGKTTVLRCLAGLERAPIAHVRLGTTVWQDSAHGDFVPPHARGIGYVPQEANLFPHLSVRENVTLPGWIAGDGAAALEARARELLGRVGLADREDDAVGKLSGGEMQRVAICRALLRRPALLLADEPTGNLDDETSAVVMSQMLELVAEEGSTLIYVTHSADQAALADETWHLHSGILETS